jgi:hypothetical protein
MTRAGAKTSRPQDGRPLIQVGQSGTADSLSSARVRRLRRRFRSIPVLRLPGLLEPTLRRFLIERTRRLRLVPSAAYDRAEDLPDVRLGNVVSALLSDPAFCKTISAIIGKTACGFRGTFCRRRSGAARFSRWHADMLGSHRLVGLTINLSPAPFKGGVFQIRSRRAPRREWSFSHGAAGDAMLFGIGERWQHRGTRIEGRHAKTIFVGFFYDAPPSVSPYRRA